MSHPWIKETPLNDNDTICARKYFQTTFNFHTASQRIHKEKGKLSTSPPTPIKIRSLVKSKTVQITHNSKNNFKELPKLITKMPNDIKDSTLYRYHFSLMRKYKGKIKNFLLPIGHNKEQKHKVNLIKECFGEYYTPQSPKLKINDMSSDITSLRKTINFKGELMKNSLIMKRMSSNQAIPKFQISQANLKVSEFKKENKPILIKRKFRVINQKKEDTNI